MITILFWNLRRQSKTETPDDFSGRQASLLNAIADVTAQYSVDILLFAEFHLDSKVLLARLQNLERGIYYYIENTFLKENWQRVPEEDRVPVQRKIQIFTRIDPDKVSEVNMDALKIKGNLNGINDMVGELTMRDAMLGETPLSNVLLHNGRFEHSRLTLRRLPISANTELLLAAVHLVDKSSSNSVSQREEARRISQRIRFAEQHIVKHTRTIIVGDFNMDPTEEGMTLPDTFHSVTLEQMSNTLPHRGIQGYDYQWSINALWSQQSGVYFPGGTYVYVTGDHIRSQWHMYDQVLIRRDVLPYWHYNGLRILTQAGNKSLLNNASEPDAHGSSDHLPIIFQLKESNED